MDMLSECESFHLAESGYATLASTGNLLARTGHRSFSYVIGKEEVRGGGGYSVCCNLQPHR